MCGSKRHRGVPFLLGAKLQLCPAPVLRRSGRQRCQSSGHGTDPLPCQRPLPSLPSLSPFCLGRAEHKLRGSGITLPEVFPFCTLKLLQNVLCFQINRKGKSLFFCKVLSVFNTHLSLFFLNKKQTEAYKQGKNGNEPNQLSSTNSSFLVIQSSKYFEFFLFLNKNCRCTNLCTQVLANTELDVGTRPFLNLGAQREQTAPSAPSLAAVLPVPSPLLTGTHWDPLNTLLCPPSHQGHVLGPKRRAGDPTPRCSGAPT